MYDPNRCSIGFHPLAHVASDRDLRDADVPQTDTTDRNRANDSHGIGRHRLWRLRW